MDPGTALLIASAISAGAQAIGSKMGSKKQKKAAKAQKKALDKAAKRRAKETKRETKAGLLEDSLKRSTELEAHRLSQGQKSSKRKATSMQGTADLVREAINI